MTAAPDFSHTPPDAFAKALAFTLQWERGKANNPLDRGGRTKDGITQHTYDAYRRRKGLPLRDVFLMEDHERDEIYFTMYWSPVQGDQIAASSDRMAMVVFDTAVNHGVVTAARLLQKTAQMGQESWDGVVGRVTLSCFRIRLLKLGPQQMLAIYLERRAGLYKAILLRDKTQWVFRTGWKNRINSLAINVGLEPVWED